MAEGPGFAAVREAQQLLNSVGPEAKRIAGVAGLAGKAVLADAGLSESLRSAVATLQAWEQACKALPDKLNDEAQAAAKQLEDVQSHRKTLLLDKRRLQLEVKNAERKRTESEDRLGKLLSEMESIEDKREDARQQAAEGGDDEAAEMQERLLRDVEKWQKRAATLQASLQQQEAQQQEPQKLEAEIVHLRNEVATLSTDAQLQRERNKDLVRKVADLEATADATSRAADPLDLSDNAKRAAAPTLRRGLGDRKTSSRVETRKKEAMSQDTLDALDASSEAPTQDGSTSPSKGGKAATDREQNREKVRQLTARAGSAFPPELLTPPVLAAASLGLFAFGFVAGTLRGGSASPAAETAAPAAE
eukprot:TRINITY_DN35249_c0_g1_i1.p1 TRINITY_DN35249_c0_g1~~TRINITY_DN35249_c0_g1_i1.p1  ORF type:complete len:362 (+),score=135.83 TRINITY_DN35249_c0_g1_i1:66-1151(+)